MAISGTGTHEEEIGGARRRLLLRNGEIERFETQHGLGIFVLWDQLFGRGEAPQVRHVRDLVALGLVGGGMPDIKADELIAAQGPDQNIRLRGIAQRLLGITFMPQAFEEKKKEDGSAAGRRKPRSATTPASES